MAAATHVRYRVVALATALAMVTYLDRACIATLAPGRPVFEKATVLGEHATAR